MKVTGLAIVPPPAAADLPKVTPELLASVLARYSRSNEGIGKILMKAGACFYQPPRIRHRELAHSRNVEMIEVVAPANFKTYPA